MNLYCGIFLLLVSLASAQTEDKWLPFQDRCVFLGHEGAKYDEAHQKCLNRGASLLILRSIKDWNSILKLLNKESQYYVGYRKSTKDWAWEDGSTFFEKDWWIPGEPGTGGPSTMFKVYDKQWRFESTKDHHAKYFICASNGKWRKLPEKEKMELCGVGFMPNCIETSCDRVCEKYPGCTTYTHLNNLCVNVKTTNDLGYCRIDLSFVGDIYMRLCD